VLQSPVAVFVSYHPCPRMLCFSLRKHHLFLQRIDKGTIIVDDVCMESENQQKQN